MVPSALRRLAWKGNVHHPTPAYMDPRLEPLASVLRLNTRLFRSCLDGMDDETGRARTGPRTNPASFIAVHLLDARAYLAGMLGQPADHPYQEELAGVTHVDEADRLPSLEGIREAWTEVSRRLDPGLEGMAAEALDAPAGQPFPVDDPSLLGALAFLEGC